MKEKPSYVIERLPKPPRKYGRNTKLNNDEALIALALEGLEMETYKSYAHAARELEPKSSEYGQGFDVLESRVERLQRAIGKAYMIKYGTSLQTRRKLR